MERFARGDSAMIHAGIWMVKGIHDNPYRKFDMGVMTWPAITKETHPLADGNHHALGGMPQNSNALNAGLEGRKLDRAVDFLMYLNSEEVGLKQAEDIWMASPLKDVITTAGPIGEYALDYTISRLRLYEPDYDKEFGIMANMNGQLYLEGKLSLEQYTGELQDRLEAATDVYMQKNNWTRENDYGLKK
jgi:ABC-type glycerol-3-phosphate transport system substrate-binding protein